MGLNASVAGKVLPKFSSPSPKREGDVAQQENQ